MSKVAKRVDSRAPVQMGVDEELFGYIPMVPVMVSCISQDGRPNIIPLISWSFVNRWPPKVTIGICEVAYTPSYFVRASYRMILDTGEFVLNFPHAGLYDQMMQTGAVTANDPAVDKFELAGLTPGKPLVVKAPTIEECPINVECAVREHQSLGSHHLFAGEVVAYHQYGELVRRETLRELEVIEYRAIDGGARKRLVWGSLPRFEDVAE
jgi:flavin reductase (DIM6/NTAB) family NADH-FMN oxidoreductase RutF